MPSRWQTRLVIYAGLHHKEQVLLIARRLGLTPNAVVGALIRVWLKAQELATEGGLLEHKTAMWLDVVVGIDGFAGAMAESGWLAISDAGLTVVKYDRHIARTAVKKCDDVIRKRRTPAGTLLQPDLKPEQLRSQTGVAAEKLPAAPPLPDAPPAKPKKAKAVPCPLFERFWEAYPKSHQQAKPKAAAEWKKLKVTAEAFDAVMAGLKVWIDSSNWKEDHGRWIPFPANFLKGRRWEDKPGAGGGHGGSVQPLGRVQSPPGKYANLKRRIVADAGDPPQPDADHGPRKPPASLFPDEDP